MHTTTHRMIKLPNDALIIQSRILHPEIREKMNVDETELVYIKTNNFYTFIYYFNHNNPVDSPFDRIDIKDM